MNRLLLISLWALVILSESLCAATSSVALAWNSLEADYRAKPGETKAQVLFTARNPSTVPVVVTEVSTSCGCTVARFQKMPWTIPPGGNADLRATVDFRGKWGTLVKTIYVTSSAGRSVLTVRVDAGDTPPRIDVAPLMMRARNVEAAMADRQAVFRDAACATCHAQPATGKLGAPLYLAACGICHDSAHRASMVPDLQDVAEAGDRTALRKIITHGVPGSLMPAFSKLEGGPLDDRQIDSLVDYVVGALHHPRHP